MAGRRAQFTLLSLSLASGEEYVATNTAVDRPLGRRDRLWRYSGPWRRIYCEPGPMMSSPLLAESVRTLPLQVAVVDDGWQVIAHVTGDIDLASRDLLRDALAPYLAPAQRVVLDLSGVTFMDTTCIPVFMNARNVLLADGGSFILRNPSSHAHRLLCLAAVSNAFTTDIG